MALDLGEKRTGVAISDPLGFTAQGLGTIESVRKDALLKALRQLSVEHGVGEVLVGLPMNMDGSLGFKAKGVLAFVPELERTLQIPVKTWDERLSSRQAGRLMIEAGLSRLKQKKHSDEIAAILILQSYLESKRSKGPA